MKLNRFIHISIATVAIAMLASCSEEYLETSPAGTIEEEAVNNVMQADPSQVQSYVAGAQMNLYCGGDYWTSHDDFGLPAVKLATDLLCEDIAYYNDAHFFCNDYQLDNRLGSYRRTSSMWNQFYNLIKNCNDIIVMLKPAEGEVIEEENTTARSILGEAYGMRALAYFWLVNLWQHPYSINPDALGVPVLTEDEYRQERVPVKDVYSLILSDIQLSYDYLEGLGYHSGNKIGLSEYAAAAIYANVLMFTSDYENAAKYAELAIKGGSLNSEEDMLGGFNSLDMPEVIWGYNVTNETTGYYASLFSHIDPYHIGYAGLGYGKLVASDLYNKIEEGDIRKQWFGYKEDYNLLENAFHVEKSKNFTDYIQNKYRDVYLTTYGQAGPFTSAIIHTRIAEMYFVAAEAYYLNNQADKALETLKTIMLTRNPAYSFSATGNELYEEICIQKRIEMWMEGCRYLDAKRRGEELDRTVSVNHSPVALEQYNTKKYSAHDYRMIYRIPTKELENNPKITAAEDNK